MSRSDIAEPDDFPFDAAEQVFAEPWQAQAFALALQLHASGAMSWGEWADALSKQLALAGPADDGSRYYEHWLAALEHLVITKTLVTPVDLSARKEAWAEAYRHTPHGQPVEL